MPRSRLFYRDSPESDDSLVVLEQNGKIVTSYRSAEELVETHIKGILAKEYRDSERVRELMRNYRPTDALTR